ncbi:MAG: hypothetical protein EOO23_06080 [Comamonadaceae bacterium]|nr:MAG: hypothetical protein EOO23_06080 [Comamonadaceae bacterium]
MTPAAGATGVEGSGQGDPAAMANSHQKLVTGLTNATAQRQGSGSAASFLEQHQALLACVISVAIVLKLQLAHQVDGFPHDSAEYWYLAVIENMQTVRGHRGYFFSLLLMPVRYLCDASGDPHTVYRVIMSVFYGCLLALLIPAFFVQAFGGKLTLLRRLVPVALIAQLFPGQLLYPLSDLPALLLTLSGLLLVLKAAQEPAGRRRFVVLMMGAGVLMGGAYNTRTIYLFTLIGLIGLLLFARSYRSSTHSRCIALAAFVSGLLVVAVPQGLLNQLTHGKFRLSVISQVNAKNLFISQMVWGITIQRYETSIDPTALAPTVFYLDPVGQRIFDRISGERDLFTPTGYLSAVARYPAEFLGLYTRHFINGLDVRDGRGYTIKASPYRNRTAAFNFMVLVLAACIAFTLRQQDRSSDGYPPPANWRLTLALVLLPVAAILPGAIETRFFLPLHLLAYCTIAFYFDSGALRELARRHAFPLGVIAVAFAGTFFAITTSTMANISYQWPAVYRFGPLPK